MITGFLTFLFFFAIVGCVLYGRKLIRTEKVDAVFGNPERAKGGIHWVIVGSSFLLLIWLYYSWDIAKSFFPRSANELCQVGKVNESLLSLKYLFPIEERQLKSTSVIETETENLSKITIEIEKSGIKNQDKSKLIDFISQTTRRPSYSATSISPRRCLKFLPRILYPRLSKYFAAKFSPSIPKSFLADIFHQRNVFL